MPELKSSWLIRLKKCLHSSDTDQKLINNGWRWRHVEFGRVTKNAGTFTMDIRAKFVLKGS